MIITIYTKSNCPNCEKTKRDMDILGIKYEAIDLTFDTEKAQILQNIGFKSLPVILAGEAVWQGYDQDKIKSLASY